LSVWLMAFACSRRLAAILRAQMEDVAPHPNSLPTGERGNTLLGCEIGLRGRCESASPRARGEKVAGRPD